VITYIKLPHDKRLFLKTKFLVNVRLEQ